MAFLDIALQHGALGLYVFPVARDKSTLTHHGYKDATVDPEKIRTWWAMFPSANPGFAPGASDVAVLDIDHGLTDMASFIAWRDRNGIPATYTVRSGSRPEFKVHMYFKGAMRDVGTWELDGCSGQVKSLGGYVLAAGSEALHGEKHDKPGAPYEGIDGTLGVFASTPDVVLNLRKPVAAPSNNSKVPKTRWNLPVHESENRTGFMLEQTGAMRNLGCGKDAILARMVELNEDPEIIADPVDYERLERTAANCAKYPVPAPPPEITIGGRKPGSEVIEDPILSRGIEEVEELDQSLRATHLPDYPLSVFDGTLYAEFAKRASEGNFVPREFFIEGAMTYAGAMAGDNLRGMAEEITPRLYTVLLAMAGFGKGTTFRRLRRLAPPHRMLDAVTEYNVPSINASKALLACAGSEPALNDALLACNRVCLVFEEMDRLMEKTRIEGSGGALMSVIRSLFDDVLPGITTTSDRKVVAPVGYLSLLGAMTPSLWRQAMEGRDSYGSGLGGRFNLVATNVSESASTLFPMDIGDLQSALDEKLAELERNPLAIPTERGALDVLAEWWAQSKGHPHYNRVNVIAHRKALHLAWMRGLPVITAEIMLQAIQLANYLLGVRDAFEVTKGEDRTAIGENRVMHILRQISPKWVGSKKVVELLDGLMSRASVFRSLESLVNSGEAEKQTVKRPGSRVYAVYRVSLR